MKMDTRTRSRLEYGIMGNVLIFDRQKVIKSEIMGQCRVSFNAIKLFWWDDKLTYL